MRAGASGQSPAVRHHWHELPHSTQEGQGVAAACCQLFFGDTAPGRLWGLCRTV